MSAFTGHAFQFRKCFTVLSLVYDMKERPNFLYHYHFNLFLIIAYLFQVIRMTGGDQTTAEALRNAMAGMLNGIVEAVFLHSRGHHIWNHLCISMRVLFFPLIYILYILIYIYE